MRARGFHVQVHSAQRAGIALGAHRRRAEEAGWWAEGAGTTARRESESDDEEKRRRERGPTTRRRRNCEHDEEERKTYIMLAGCRSRAPLVVASGEGGARSTRAGPEWREEKQM